MPLPFEFDFKKPDYISVFEWRFERLRRIRNTPGCLDSLKIFYRDNPAQFIIDWGVTSDPRNIEIGQPAVIPLLLFPRQEEWVNWCFSNWKNRRPGITVKSREVGLTWIFIALSCTLCLFNEGLIIGAGSRKEEYVDKLGEPGCLFYKAREFVRFLPEEFKGDWDPIKNAPHRLINFPATKSKITGEAGDNIGRGNRTSIYFIDEAAFLEHPQLIDASLSQTTNCRMYISTPHGMGNPFAEKYHANKIPQFTFSWRDDPRKDEQWYQQQKNDINDPVIIAQELDLDFSASLEGVLIPAIWVNAAIDAHIKLNVKPTGVRKAALDVADRGPDLNALAGRYGILVADVNSWSGRDEDIYKTVERTVKFCELNNYERVCFDTNGIGAGVRGDARIINEKRAAQGLQIIPFIPFDSAGKVADPDEQVYPDHKIKFRTNEDFFVNAKAQAWWSLRRRFQMTYRAVIEGKEFKEDEIISLSSSIPELSKLIMELSQPTFSENNTGKIIVDKTPDGAKSPNLADAVMILFSSEKREARSFFDVD